MTERRNPWGKWYWGDWRKDVPLRMCSFAARGLWADVLSLMADAAHFGALLVKGLPPTDRQLASLLGGTDKDIRRLMSELGEAGVYSRVGDADPASPTCVPDDVMKLLPAELRPGTIISRRMVRDKAKAAAHRENGGKGGNPKLKRENNQDDNHADKPPVNQGVNPSVKAQKLEARDHSQEERAAATDSVSARDAGPDPAARLIAIFDEERASVFGKHLARQWPSAKDHVHAQAFVKAGATPDSCRAVFRAVFQRQKAQGKRPADNLGYMAGAIDDALLDIPPAMRRAGSKSNGADFDPDFEDRREQAAKWVEEQERARTDQPQPARKAS